MTRIFLAAVVAAALTGCGPAPERDVLRVGVTNTETQADILSRYEPLRAHLARKLGRKVSLRSATDYAGVIEALKSRQLDVVYIGAASYARAWLLTNGGVKPLLGTLDAEGNLDYHSMLVARTDSRFRSVADLKGASIAFADPNSTSGYIAPSFFLAEEGFAPKTFFARSGFAGSHEMAVISVFNKTYDAAATWWYNADRTNLTRMEGKGLIPKGALREIWRSPGLPSSPWTVRTDSTEAFNTAFQQAVMSFAKEDPRGFRHLTANRESGYAPITHEAYEPVIRMVRENLAGRKDR